MAAFTTIAAGVGLLGSVAGGISSGKAAKRAADNAASAQSRLAYLEKQRQPIINPYANVKDLSGMVTDLSGMISNPYANLGVATQAAEIKIEEADIALANTLDTLRSTGSSAGGATALAQAALQSKKGVAASIESQEAQNEQLRAQGQSQLDQLKMQEAQRIQGVQFSEAGRMQQAESAGALFKFQQKETRQMQGLNRAQAQITGFQQQEAAANQNQAAMIGAGIVGLGNIAGSIGGGGGGGNKTPGIKKTGDYSYTAPTSGYNYRKDQHIPDWVGDIRGALEDK